MLLQQYSVNLHLLVEFSFRSNVDLKLKAELLVWSPAFQLTFQLCN